MMTHVISLLVHDHDGVLSRISGLFSGRGYSMESITSGPDPDKDEQRITIVCSGDDQIIEQIKKQLNKLIDVIELVDLTAVSSVHRELMLIKVKAKPGERGELFQIADAFSAKVMDVGVDSVMLEVSGTSEKIDDILSLMREFTILETARSGLISLPRGEKYKEGSDAKS